MSMFSRVGLWPFADGMNGLMTSAGSRKGKTQRKYVFSVAVFLEDAFAKR